MEVIIIDNFNFTEMPCMRYWSHPKSYDEQRKKREAREMMLSGDYIGARKKDGIWAMIIKDKKGEYHLRARSKNVQGTYADKAEWIVPITDELSSLPNETVLLGEIYKYGDEGSRKATAILNCLKDKSIERQKKDPLHFYMFDCLAWGGKSLIETPIFQRIEYITKVKELNALSQLIEYATYYEGEELLETYYSILAEGGEGIVIQKKNAPYTCGKRTARLTLKCKRELQDTLDAYIDGEYKAPTQEYTGKNIEGWTYWRNVRSGELLPIGMHYNKYRNGEPIVPITKYAYYEWAGAISFSMKKEDGTPIHIAWISGITDEMRRGIVEEPEKWINKVYELTAMQTELIDGVYSLRHGKIVGERTDKTPEDCSYNQIAKT